MTAGRASPAPISIMSSVRAPEVWAGGVLLMARSKEALPV